MQRKGSCPRLLQSERGAGARQEQELQAEIAALLARLECQAQEAAQLQRHREQARELTADLQATTRALEASQATLQETAHTLKHTLQQLSQVPTAHDPYERSLHQAKAQQLQMQAELGFQAIGLPHPAHAAALHMWGRTPVQHGACFAGY